MTAPTKRWNLDRRGHRAKTGILSMIDVVVQIRVATVAIVAAKPPLPVHVVGQVLLRNDQVLRVLRLGKHPFFSAVGVPGTGKSTMLKFLWKLLGRDRHEPRIECEKPAIEYGQMFTGKRGTSGVRII